MTETDTAADFVSATALRFLMQSYVQTFTGKFPAFPTVFLERIVKPHQPESNIYLAQETCAPSSFGLTFNSLLIRLLQL